MRASSKNEARIIRSRGRTASLPPRKERQRTALPPAAAADLALDDTGHDVGGIVPTVRAELPAVGRQVGDIEQR